MIVHKQLRSGIGIVLCLSFLLSCKEARHQDFLFPEHLLREGDLAFRCGRSMASNTVLAADAGGEYSHVGIVVKQNDTFKIIHAVPDEHDNEYDVDRVKMDDIQTFFSPEKSIYGAIMRVNDSTIATTAAHRALQIIEQGTLFDHNYDLSDSSKMYCTELIYFVYKEAGIDLTEGRRSNVKLPVVSGTYIFPSDIQKNSSLQLLYRY
mgnify:CR=1 FL=1